MVPEGWALETVGNLFDAQLGKMLNKTAKEKHPQFPYLGNTNVKWGRINFDSLNTMYFSEKDREKFSLENGDILLCEGGEVGRCAIWKGKGEIYYQKALHRLRSKGRIIPEFFQAYMEKISGTKVLDDLTTRTSIAHLTREKLIELIIKLPPIAEQQKIAKILSTWDEAIATTEQLLANSEQQKKALMQQLLTGKKRLPGFKGEWRKLTLGELFSERKEAGITGLPLLSITSEHGIINRNDVGRKDTSSADKSKYLKVCPGDIAYNTMRMWQGVSSLSSLEGIVSPAYTVLKPKDGVDSSFAAYLFKLPIMIHRFYRHSQGLVSDTWNLKYKQFSSIKVILPGQEEQKAIAGVLAKEDDAIACLERQLEKLKSEKIALMQQLLTGKRRVKLTDKETAK